MGSLTCAVVIDVVLWPQRIWDCLDVANKMGGLDCPMGCPPSIGLPSTRVMPAVIVEMVETAATLAGSCRKWMG
ncbi:hypothetical protein ACLOJK_037339, partial [Asimina triloba]